MSKEISRLAKLRKIREDDRLRARIAENSGISRFTVADEEVMEFYKPKRYRPDLIAKYRGANLNQRQIFERGQLFSQLAEALFDLEPNHHSYGLFTPSYLEGLTMQEALQSEDTKVIDHPHTSLLVGALTTDTIHEYAATVRRMHPDARCAVIDIEGDRTPYIDQKIASFAYGHAFKIPLADGSLNSVHTNFLLRYFPTKDKEENNGIWSRADEFYSEAARVLQDDGVLLMVEPEVHFFEDHLKKAGLPYIKKMRAKRFHLRREMERAVRMGNRIDDKTYSEIPEVPDSSKVKYNFYVASKVPLG